MIRAPHFVHFVERLDVPDSQQQVHGRQAHFGDGVVDHRG